MTDTADHVDTTDVLDRIENVIAAWARLLPPSALVAVRADLITSCHQEITDLRARAAWKWHGYAGHFVGGSRCAFHMSTRIGGHLVSTLGDYRPKSGDGETPEPLGLGPTSLFETMVFACDDEDEHGNTNIVSYDSIDGERYGASLPAEQGHLRYCEKYHQINREKNR